MKKAEELLSDELYFGYSSNQPNTYIPTLWEVAQDLERYIKDGLLVEIPVSCTLKEILDANQARLKHEAHPLLKQVLHGDRIVRFKTIPNNILYELLFGKDENTSYSGYFRKIS